jgi:protocatechuate 3,4-dioxygenase beta subunit
MRISFLFGAVLLILTVAFSMAEQEPTSQSSATFKGIVVDAHGSPVAGAIIEIDQEMPIEDGGEIENLDAFWEEYESAEDGTFRIPGLRHGGRYDVTVKHPRFVEKTLTGVKAPNAEPVRIVLQGGGSLAGRVVGPEGEPVPGAMIHAVEEEHSEHGVSRSSHSIASTDQEGRFRAYGLPPGSLILEVKAAGYTPRRVDDLHISEDQDLKDFKIVLDAGLQLDIQVLDARGKPVPNKGVYVMPEGTGEVRSFFENHCDTGNQGRCRRTVSQAGVYEVHVTQGGFHAAGAMSRVRTDGKITPVEIRLPGGVEISGRVLGEDGTPTSRAEVLLSWGEKNHTGGSVGQNGNFRFSDVADGKYRLIARPANTTHNSSATVLEIEVAGQALRDLELRLPKP